MRVCKTNYYGKIELGKPFILLISYKTTLYMNPNSDNNCAIVHICSHAYSIINLDKI